MRLYLKLPADADPALRARLGYAFRLFCAIYGHWPVLEASQACSCDATIRYRALSGSEAADDSRTVWLSRGYRARDPRKPAPPPVRYELDDTSTVLHSEPRRGATPDWLGEIFEWVSCADEYSVTERDRVGRPLYASTYGARHGIDMRIPYAAVAMRALQQEIRRVVPGAASEPRPLDGAPAHFVIPSHDVDYFPATRMRAAARLARNAVFSAACTFHPKLGLHQAGHAVRVACGIGSDPLDRILLLAEEERRLGIRSTFNFLVRHAHRLDARYSLEDAEVVDTMRWLRSAGMEIGLHGSYTSLDAPDCLEQEMRAMRAHGFAAVGGRQHWLRYTMDRLIPAVERAGMEYDSSIGWSTSLGFRAGACFAFPPYDFAREAPAGFLELPLIAMDQALLPGKGFQGEPWREVADMLAWSRRLGWGGVSLLWHPAAFGTGWLPADVGESFWRLAEEGARSGDQWVRACDFVHRARSRFVQTGLLPAEKKLVSHPRMAGSFEIGAAEAREKRHGPSVQIPQNAIGA